MLGHYFVFIDGLFNIAESSSGQGCSNPRNQVTWATKFHMVAPNICGSLVWYIFYIILVANWILRWLQIFGKFVNPWIRLWGIEW